VPFSSSTTSSTAPLRFHFPSAADVAAQGPALLGHIAWLWSQSPLHAHWPCHLLQTQVIPALGHQQCVWVGDGEQPVAYASWALLSDEAQQRYVHNPNALRATDWRSGPHMWWIDWVAPFGHTAAIAAHLRRHVFAHRTTRALRVKRDRTVGRIIDLHGDAVPLAARQHSQQQFAAQFVQPHFTR
jgi:cytolysin-activating lysine-acyltransferase